MQIDASEEHPQNACTPRDDTCEWDSNVTTEREAQLAKQRSPMVLTAAKTKVDERAEQSQNAQSPSTESREPGSNVGRERE
jgi:hypothetical protein